MTERNNQDRVAVPQQVPPEPSQPSQIQTPNVEKPQPMQFSVPTEFVDLPSKGKYYPQGHPLRGRESVEVKFMTAKEEDILASTALIRRGVVFERLLQSVMLDRIDPNDLLIGDKNALLIATRISGYGPEYETEVQCPSCSNKSEFTFDLSEAQVKSDAQPIKYGLLEEEAAETENGTFVFEVPALNCTVEVKLLNGHDEKRLSQITKAKNKNKLVESFVTDTLKSYIVSVNGDSSRATVNQFVDTLPARQSRYIRTAYRRIVPTVSIESEYSCSNCGHTQDLEVPLNADFFWPNK